MIEIDVAIDTYDAYEIDRRELGVQRWTGRKDKELVGGIRVSFFFFLDILLFISNCIVLFSTCL